MSFRLLLCIALSFAFHLSIGQDLPTIDPILSDSISLDSITLEVELPTLDTIYYGRNGKGTKHASFAAYYRVMPNHNDPDFEQIFRDFYSTGELKKEGAYISIDSKDDTKSVFDGECISYFKSGKVNEKVIFENGEKEGIYECFFEDGLVNIRSKYTKGLLNGLFCEYYRNGKIKKQVPYVNGKKSGIVYEISEDGKRLKEIEYDNDSLKNDYYYLRNEMGCSSKMSFANDSVIWDKPEEEDVKTIYNKGIRWDYIDKNGLQIAFHVYPVKEHGNYFRADIAIANNSLESFEFDIDNMFAVCSTEMGNERLGVLGADEFLDHVQSCHAWASFAEALAGSMVTLSAGNSVSTTTSNSTISGSSSTTGSAIAIGSNGWGMGLSSSSTGFSGNVTTTSSTRSYDATAAAITRSNVIQANKDRQMQRLNERKVIESGYAKRTTIGVGEAYSGFFSYKI